MPFLKLARSIPGATEIKTIAISGSPSNYWLNKEVWVNDSEDNVAKWRVFCIITEHEYQAQQTALLEEIRRRSTRLSASPAEIGRRSRNYR